MPPPPPPLSHSTHPPIHVYIYVILCNLPRSPLNPHHHHHLPFVCTYIMTSLEPGQQIRPSVSANGAILLIERLYGVKVHAIKELNSYDDRNFLVTLSSTTPESHVTHHGGNDKYTLKILNSLDSQKNHVGKVKGHPGITHGVTL